MSFGKKYEEVAWAAFATHGSPRPFIHVHSVGPYREGVQRYVGKVHAREGETWRQGWRRAYRKGWRAIRVLVDTDSNE